MKKIKIYVCVLMVCFLSACGSKSEYTLTAMSQSNEETESIITYITILYNDKEVKSYEKEVTYTFENDVAKIDILQRVQTQEAKIKQLDKASASIEQLDGKIVYCEKVVLSEITSEELSKADEAFQNYSKDGNFDIEKIRTYLTEQNYSISEEKVS